VCKNKNAKAFGDFASPRYKVDLSPCYLSYISRYYIICILFIYRKWFNHRLRIWRSLVFGNSHGSLPWHTLVNIVEFSLCRIFDMVHCRNTVHVYSRWESVYDPVQYIYGEKHLRGQQSLYKRKRTLPRGWWVSSMRLKARGLAQHGTPHGWLEESELACVILFVMDGLFRLSWQELPSYELKEFPAAVI